MAHEGGTTHRTIGAEPPAAVRASADAGRTAEAAGEPSSTLEAAPPLASLHAQADAMEPTDARQ